MAEVVAFRLASKVLSVVASPALKYAYEKGVSIWEAKNELAKLQVSVETIHASLLDAENKQEGSNLVKDWIKRVKGVLYDAEDLFEEVLTEDLLKQQMMDGKNKLSLKKQVRISCSKLNPIISRNSIAGRVKAIRKTLVEITVDMAQLGFIQCQPNDPMIGTGGVKNTSRCFIGEKLVIGRDGDKNAILKMLISESSDTTISDDPDVIVIDGIGGMGKTTLAHLIFNHGEIKKMFENKWFACMSNTTVEKEVLGKIYHSICGKGYSDLDIVQLQENIMGSIAEKKYLLVLDDVWDDDRGRWKIIRSMLSSGAKGSKIIVTTRLQSVMKAMGAVGTHNLKGLSEEGSWDLFKSLAFDSPYENDSRRENVGRKLLQKCRGVPLAIWCMGSLLYNKTIQEWEEIERVSLPTIRGQYNDEIMSVLKLSYNHLPSNLKQCFTYCSLFPKDYRYKKMELIWHWIAQGYIHLDEGESSFMHLLRMGFLQEMEEDAFGEIESCKIHDIIHDLAMHLGCEETIVMSNTSLNLSSCTRHVSLTMDGEEGGLRDIPTSLINVKSMRSCIISGSSPNLGQICSIFKLLRTLALSNLGIEHVPPSIGELKLLRYLDLSSNEFQELPDSVANLVNLLVLDITECKKFKAWPQNFKKLVQLLCLKFSDGYMLRLMPEGLGGIASLQHLSHFNVGKRSELDVLNGLLKQLRGYLPVTFCGETVVEDEMNWQLPVDVSLQRLVISFYPGKTIQGWGNNKCTSKLEHLVLSDCWNVKYLPLLSCLPNLKHLAIDELPELEFMEEEEMNTHNNAPSNNLFFPCLKKLVLVGLSKLKGWRRKVATEATSSSSTQSASLFMEFTHLSELDVEDCPNLKSFPKCPNLQKFVLRGRISSTDLFSYTYPSLRQLDIVSCSKFKKLHLVSPHLQRIEIEECMELMCIELVGSAEPSLRYISIKNCKQLKSLQIEEHPIASLEYMTVTDCPELKLSEPQGKRLSLQKGQTEVEGCELELERVDAMLVEQLLSSLSSIREIRIKECKGPMSLPGEALTSLRECHISKADVIESLHIPSPHLQDVSLQKCMGLISAEFEVATMINIDDCSKLKNLRIAQPNSLKLFSFNSSPSAVTGVDWDSVPNLSACSCISSISLTGADGVFIERLLSSPSPSPSSLTSLQGNSVFKSIGSVTVALTSLETFIVNNASDFKILNIQSPRLRYLAIQKCSQLRKLRIVNPIALTTLGLVDCPELGLSTGVDWDALTDLSNLGLSPLPPPEEIPQCLLQRQALGHLKISDWWV